MAAEPKCPVCAAASPRIFLRRGGVPVHQNLLMRDQAAATKVERGDLHLAVCEACGFIFNQAFEGSRPLYGDNYDNTQTCSPYFQQYLDGLVRHLVVDRQVRQARIVEVGCGQGLFLRKLLEIEQSGNRGYGFDPSYTGPGQDLDGRLTFFKEYYGPASPPIEADVVVCRHVIEHVPDPVGLIRQIRQTLGSASRPRVFFETPCVAWILKNRVFWDFFYEHCSYFTGASLTTALEAGGFQLEELRQVFQGQYLWVEAKIPARELPLTRQPGETPDLARAFARAEDEAQASWRKQAGDLAAGGRVALWGAGAKGVTFANLVDPHRRYFAGVVDLNPQKQGKFIPGTGHPIISPTELGDYGITAAVLLNPNYREENLALLRHLQLDIRLIDA